MYYSQCSLRLLLRPHFHNVWPTPLRVSQGLLLLFTKPCICTDRLVVPCTSSNSWALCGVLSVYYPMCVLSCTLVVCSPIETSVSVHTCSSLVRDLWPARLKILYKHAGAPKHLSVWYSPPSLASWHPKSHVLVSWYPVGLLITWCKADSCRLLSSESIIHTRTLYLVYVPLSECSGLLHFFVIVQKSMIIFLHNSLASTLHWTASSLQCDLLLLMQLWYFLQHDLQSS